MPSPVPKDRFCDVVMKGGVTSGVVYPRAIEQLARAYRLKNIGGSSAGAIAAAIAAAAEYRRYQTGEDAGFELLRSIPTEMARCAGVTHRRLLTLFKPDRCARRLFGLLTSTLNIASPAARATAAVVGVARHYWPAALASLIAATLVALLHSRVAGGLSLIITSVTFVGGWFVSDVLKLVDNGYGMTKGMTVAAGPLSSLTPWLHSQIQLAAGLNGEGAPLTFGQLWRADSSGPEGERTIDLRVFSTNLSHGRPYVLPLENESEPIYYDSDELGQYLPLRVMQWLNGLPGNEPKSVGGRKGVRQLPLANDFPVLLAARLSLSFPILLCPIPLLMLDNERKSLRRCLFSDGGICSNFPIHFFDAFVPRWPTFGIQLEDNDQTPIDAKHPAPTAEVNLPTYADEVREVWDGFAEGKTRRSRLFGFLNAILQTTLNWQDNVQARLPGVRDRVVRLRIDEGEGGLNLNMTRALIERLAERGEKSAQVLIDRFLPVAGSSKAWDEQRWARLDVFLHTLRARLDKMRERLGPQAKHATSYPALIAESEGTTPPFHDRPMDKQQIRALQELVAAVTAAEDAFASDPARSYAVKPLPPSELRVRAPL